VEAGFKLNGSLLEAGMVDELVVYLAPHLIGDQARGMFNLPELTELGGKRALAIREVRMVGPDLQIVARLR
jgi:diaminohydroxyphosphoribosylaminopyrimidine deaminase/5-amino-6-(5-phosphoribosylamino)uracil reductase